MSPANVNARAAAGHWAVTEKGQATFTFALPDDVAELLSAEIVVLPSANDEISYEVSLALTQEGFVGDDYTDVLEASNLELVGQQIVEIDISSVIPPFEMLVPGRDYLTVSFVAESVEDAGIAEAANVLGLRIGYKAGTPDSAPDEGGAAGGGSDAETSDSSGVSRIASRQSDGSLPSTEEASPSSASTRSAAVVSPKPDTQGRTVERSATPVSARPRALTGGAQFKTSGNASIGADLEVIGRLQSDENSNTAVGTSSLVAITSGTSNTAVGEEALAANTTGASNTAVGHKALSANDIGVQNTAIGNDALTSNLGSTIVPPDPELPYGSNNTAIGFEALTSNLVGERNTAIGALALSSNEGSLVLGEHSQGSANTAIGYEALAGNVSGFNNTAIGSRALASNETGNRSTAVGEDALMSNTTGTSNTAIGEDALRVNTGGSSNVAVGEDALDSNVGGNNNTALGTNSLQANTSGVRNTAVGADALTNSTGGDNTAVGKNALLINDTGNANTGIGRNVLTANTTGSNNIALGESAGNLLTTGNDNIAIGNAGVAAEAGTIRIGTTGTQTRTFVAGISGVAVAGGVNVVVNAAGQLGIAVSSRRYKEEIQDMGDSSEGLLALRPVTYRYKSDVHAGDRPTEFGLIAEEVAEVYPDLVAYDDGQAVTVRYHVLITMLLNELQREHRRNGEQEQLIHQLSARLARLESYTDN